MKFIHAKMTFVHMKSLIYGHIHPCRWIKITLSFKLQAQNSKLKLRTHAQAIFKDKPIGIALDHKITIIDLYDFFDKDGTLPIFVHPSNFLFFNHIFFYVSLQSFLHVVSKLTLFFLSVMDCFKVMYFAPYATLELKELNYNTLWIKNVPSIISAFDIDVLFEFPFIDNSHGHFGYMQGMDKKYSGHSWWKVKMININNDFNLVFHKIRCLDHLQC